MTATDPDLTGLARKINAEGWTCLLGVHEPGQYDTCDDCRDSCDEAAHLLLPLVTAAQAEAWDEGFTEASQGDENPFANSYRYIDQEATR